MRITLATIVGLALLLSISAQAQQSPTQPAPSKRAAPASGKSKGSTAKTRVRAAAAPAFGAMTEESGCHILNKGRRGQICYYDVTRHRPEKQASLGVDLPIFISARKHETILWHKGGGMGFHVIGLELRSGQNPNCPKQAFDNDFKDDDNEEWHDVVASGLPNPLAARYRCEYKTHFKWQDGQRGDPHIIIGEPDQPPDTPPPTGP